MKGYHDVLLELAEAEIAELRKKLTEALPYITIQSVQREIEEVLGRGDAHAQDMA